MDKGHIDNNKDRLDEERNRWIQIKVTELPQMSLLNRAHSCTLSTVKYTVVDVYGAQESILCGGVPSYPLTITSSKKVAYGGAAWEHLGGKRF
jgi:hypothetical protein